MEDNIIFHGRKTDISTLLSKNGIRSKPVQKTTDVHSNFNLPTLLIATILTLQAAKYFFVMSSCTCIEQR